MQPAGAAGPAGLHGKERMYTLRLRRLLNLLRLLDVVAAEPLLQIGLWRRAVTARRASGPRAGYSERPAS